MALTLRNVKGSALTHTEMDDNFTYLEDLAQMGISSEGSQLLQDINDLNFVASGAAGVTVSNDGDGSATVDITATDTDTDTHTGVSQAGSQTLADVDDINFIASGSAGVSVTDDGDGSVTVEISATDTDTTYTAGAGLNLSGSEFSLANNIAPTVIDFASEHDVGTITANTIIDWNNGNDQVVTLGADVTLSFTNLGVGHKQLRIVQDSTGGRTPTLPAGKWPGGSAGSFSTAAGAEDILSIFNNGSNLYFMLSTGWA